MLTVCTAEISSKSFWPEGLKIFGDQKMCAGNQILKLRSQLAPRIFFLSQALCRYYSNSIAIVFRNVTTVTEEHNRWCDPIGGSRIRMQKMLGAVGGMFLFSFLPCDFENEIWVEKGVFICCLSCYVSCYDT